MYSTIIHTIDLHFQGINGTIAAYLIPHKNGAVLIESGPASTFPVLLSSISRLGYKMHQISDVFLTHIHLDHAGAAGWLADLGTRIHVHAAGAPHLVDPSRLLSSAQRLYGDQLHQLWGEIKPVPEGQVHILTDGEDVRINDLAFRILETPGHANHHLAFIFEGICFSGDVGGVRLNGFEHIRLPLVPPDFHIEKWRQTLRRLKEEKLKYIAPTHFGMFDNPEKHLDTALSYLDGVEVWMSDAFSGQPSPEEIKDRFNRWQVQQSGLSGKELQNYEIASPTFLSIEGMQRYWRKYRM